uniref:HECT-type E3 ubiquitin transferase n=2 Tax=Cyclopterus lumpus TaxID=8103 RepID=A0A8C2ZK71_CYCLU
MVDHVEVWKKALSGILSLKPVPRNSGVRNLLLVLQYMYNANSRIAEPQRMPETNFCLLIDKEILVEDLQLWRRLSQRKYMHAEPLFLCNFPILMDLESKKFVFDQNATYTKMEATDWTMFLGLVLFQEQYFVLHLSRASLLDDTFEQLDAADHEDYKLPIAVYFDENFTNSDDDALYRKDFFHEVFHEMMSPETGMFMFNDSKTLAWFPKATEEDQRYFLFGVLCGLALYNQHIIHLPFPLALFKKLLGVKPSLGDMIEFSPCVGQCLLNILEHYEDNVIKDLDWDFAIYWDGIEVDLDPKSPEKPLTGENKKEFVDAFVNHAFNTSVEGVFQEFKRGFFQVCDQDLVKLFRPKELQDVLVGADFHDWAKLKQNTVYEGVYSTTPPHPTIQMFWEVFDELTEDQKKAFLWFVTGFERVPILGMEKIELKVKVKVPDLSYDQDYPATHTCFSMLELPLYSTKEIMQTKLTEALSKNRRSYK